jgi:MoxR-like ATPase
VLTLEPIGAPHGAASVVAHLDGDGLAFAFRVQAADSDEVDQNEAARRQRLRDQLDALPSEAREALAALGDEWEYVVVEAGRREALADLDAWLATLAADPRLAGEVCLRLDPDAVEEADDEIADDLRALVGAAFPLLATAASAADDPVSRLVEVMHWNEDRAQALVDLAGRSRQLLFAGPPGTGKTLAARTLANALTPGYGHVRLVQFHPTYAYEDFVEGIRPVLAGDDGAEDGLRYELRPGILRLLLDDAAKSPEATFILIVDEINRANLPRVLGELLFGLEYRGAGNEVELPYSGDRIYVPENLWLIGTMNTADRSVALMDAAMRRRFREFRFDVDLDALRRWHARRTAAELGGEAAARLARLNTEVVSLLDEDRAVGHSFLMRADLADVGFDTIWAEDLAPVLRDHLLGRSEDLPALEEAFLGEL